MTRRIAILAAAVALAASALPARAADLYGYGYGGEPPPSAYGRDDLGPERHGYRRGPGPVVFDERGGFERHDGFGAERGRDLPPPPPAYGRPGGFGPGPRGFEAGYGGDLRPAPFFRPAVAPVGPAFGDAYGVLDGGCTVERARSITPAGWQKTVTRRVCYRR